jgi:group I intron endonuclease
MEGSTREQRNEREESWIAQFYDKGIGCYNLQEKAAGESKNPGELKVKRSQQLREQWRDPVWRASTTVNISKSLMGHVVNEVTRQNMSKAHKGKPNGKLGSMHSDEAKSKIGQAQIGNKKRAKTWEVALIAPDGTIYEGIDCLAEFAKQHDLHKQDLHKVVTGKRLSCKGWKLLVL